VGKPTGPIPENRLIRTPLPGLGGSGTGGSKELPCQDLGGLALGGVRKTLGVQGCGVKDYQD